MPPHIKEVLFLAEQAAEGKLKVLPGDSWSLHYPADGNVRAEKLAGLLEGKYRPEQAAKDLQPDALLYDIADIERQGLEKVSARIREVSATVAHYDYEKFASFVSSMRGKNIDLGTIQSLYDGIAQSRIRQRLLDAYGHTGKKQLETALREEASELAKSVGSMPGLERVLSALKIEWLQRKGLADSGAYAQVQSQMTDQERALLQKLADAYTNYAEKGSEQAYQSLVQSVKDTLPELEKLEDQMSPSMEQLQKELEPFMDQTVPPGMPGDPAIPPDDEDEYHTPPPQEQNESAEGVPNTPIFEITPNGTSKAPLVGYYCGGRKSHYDINTKTWSKKKRLTPYNATLGGTERQTIRGAMESGLKALDLPSGYALDISSLQCAGAKPEFFRDQNGCFYYQSTGKGTFSIDFLKENQTLTGSPIAEDTQPIYTGSLSTQTESLIGQLRGSVIQKAQQIQKYVTGHHFYPGGGDAQAAQALQWKLRQESTGADYVQHLDQSEYLECYSANTLFTGLCRKAGVPARLVVGHKIDGARQGKAVIDASTGHAWSEIWDGGAWRRIDATPPPKPQDKKKEDDNGSSDSTPSQEADDAGLESPQQAEGKGDVTDQVRDRVQKQLESVQNQNMKDASSGDVSQGESMLQDAEEALEQMEQKQQELEQKMQDAKSFEDMQDLRKEMDQSDLLDEMKQEMERKIDAKEEQMKEGMREEMDKMEEDGFMDEERKRQLQDRMEKMDTEKLDALKKEMEREKGLYREYEDLKAEVEPLVEHWFRYFAECLPRQSDIQTDEDSLTRQGAWDKHAAMKFRNLLFGTLRNPRVIESSMKPRFLASIMLDVSGSMASNNKLKNATKLLVFYCELFTRISREFGYIRFAINIFSDSLTEIKAYDQDYDSPQRYNFAGGKSTTIKARLMTAIKEQGGTNMLDALKKASADLNEETFDYPDHVSAFYFLGDGGDTCGNKSNIQKFLAAEDKEHGFGEHMRSAVLLGNESERQALAELFGDANTTVAPDFETLVEQSMFKFADDIEGYAEKIGA